MISNIIVLIAVAISIYLFTFSQSVTILFPSLLIGIAIGLQWYLGKHKKANQEDWAIEEENQEDWAIEEDLTGKRIHKDVYYSIIGIVGMLATSLFVGYISYKALDLSVTNSALFGIEMAVAEEMFFRGVVFNYLLDEIVHHPTMAMLASAIIFMIYHSAVYGGNEASLLYVFIGGFILAWVTYKSGSLTSSMIAHSVNNILAAFSLVVVSDKFIAATTLLHIIKLGTHL